MIDDDLQRLKTEYKRRAKYLSENNRYSLFNDTHLFIIQQRARQVLKLLHRNGFNPLRNSNILEIGCGQGSVLLEYLGFGAEPKYLHGCDLLPDRVQKAHGILPEQVSLVTANGQHLPYKSGSFELVLQYTVFSSILSEPIKQDIATEMLRVVKPGGMLLWYDFWLNPTNPQTRGIKPTEIQRLFPACRVELHKITLAPPLARVLVPISWFFSTIVEQLGLFNTHYLAAIWPEG